MSSIIVPSDASASSADCGRNPTIAMFQRTLGDQAESSRPTTDVSDMIVPFQRDRLPSTPWKNGGGLTREIVRRPEDAQMDDFTWRVSLAELSADGPFSRFEGIDRVIVLLSGAGVHLQSDEDSTNHMLDTPLMPFAFAGESAISASLIGGASSDFNVMTRRGSTKADVRIVRAPERLDVSAAGVLFAARGTWSGRTAESTYSLPENAGIWWDGESLTWDVVPESAGALIAVRIIQALKRSAH
jgi:environmental stress-induced protein Ves